MIIPLHSDYQEDIPAERIPKSFLLEELRIGSTGILQQQKFQLNLPPILLF
jgi:hypothetical protein